MNQEHRDLIRKNYMKLTDDLKPGIEDVCKILRLRGVISQHMEEDIIEGERTGRRRTQALLDLIVTRGPYAFDALYEAAREFQLHNVCNILKPQLGSHYQPPASSQQGSGYESDDTLPDVWPSTDSAENAVTAKLIQPSDANLMQLYKRSLSPDQDAIYPMRREQRGRCLIINNETFDDINLGNRDGTIMDRRGLETLFREFNFDVEVRSNLTKEKMRNTLLDEAKPERHENADCFVLFILSHGHTGVVFGTDGKMEGGQPQNCIKIKEIRDLFCQVTTLRGKPKLFFIQACQGTQKDGGLAVGEASDGGAVYNDVTSVLKDLGPKDDNDAIGQKTGSQAHVFVAMATTADYLSWRNTRHGTWFIQAIVYVFSKYAYKRSLDRLMTLVNRLVGKAETQKGQYKQVGEKTDTLQRTFYFFPGLHEGMIN